MQAQSVNTLLVVIVFALKKYVFLTMQTTSIYQVNKF